MAPRNSTHTHKKASEPTDDAVEMKMPGYNSAKGWYGLLCEPNM
jgi:hypothetical protein